MVLQRPEASKLPKVVRRGHKSSFGQLEKWSPKSLLHQCNPLLHHCSRLLVHICTKTPFAPSYNHFGQFLRLRASIAGSSGRKLRWEKTRALKSVTRVSRLRDAETTILTKFAFWTGLGRGKIYGKLSQNAAFPGKFHDNKIW